ncbi:MAG: hypothetical protein BEN19_09060 [Epulopiscium sp. Nuni2H_MBin003]|nr:MAG: hypothetical protein BEN19_09060 [Epulopiscium sp. Nuni2H_MBin003]
MRNDFDFFHQIRVRFGEVDQQGIVYNGNYSIYTDVAFEEYFRAKGHPYKYLAEGESEICHRKYTATYSSSAVYDDLLDVGVRLKEIGTRSFTLIFEIYRAGENELLFDAQSVYVGYDSTNRCSQPISPLMRKLLTE